jgi:integrase
MRKTLTNKGVVALKPRAERYAAPDPQLTGHYVRVQPSGAKAFVAVARDPAGKQLWTTISTTDVMNITEARELARDIIKRVRAGLPAVEPKAETFGSVVENWLKRHVDANALISSREINRLLDVHVLPSWRDREFIAIRRSDVAALLDRVEDGHSARQADYVLNVVRSIMNWYATRHDDYNPPIVKGMKRQKVASRARVLDDGEIRQVWKAAESNGTFGAIVRMCLLTAQRSRKVAAMKWSDFSDDSGEWSVPKESREKDTGGILALPALALAIIRAQDQIGDNPHVFAGRGDGPYRGFSAGKVTLDSKLPPGTPGWTIHDLRRTARSLMSRAGVSSEHAEKVMGHVVGGIEGVYDRHVYRDEKADALRRLAALIEGIVHPRDNVTPMMVKLTKRRRHVR